MEESELQDSGWQVTASKEGFSLLKVFGWSIALFLIFGTAVYFTIFPTSIWPFQRIPSLVLATSLVLLLIAVRIRANSLVSYQELGHLYEQIEEAQQAASDQPNKAKPAWQLASLTLQTYYARNLQQNRMIFWLSVAIILIGFGLIVVAIAMALLDPLTVTIAVVGGSAGIITELIGATCLVIFRSTVEQSLRYTAALERTNNVGMALAILDTVIEEA